MKKHDSISQKSKKRPIIARILCLNQSFLNGIGMTVTKQCTGLQRCYVSLMIEWE
jgi:hypothetical protein